MSSSVSASNSSNCEDKQETGPRPGAVEASAETRPQVCDQLSTGTSTSRRREEGGSVEAVKPKQASSSRDLDLDSDLDPERCHGNEGLAKEQHGECSVRDKQEKVLSENVGQGAVAAKSDIEGSFFEAVESFEKMNLKEELLRGVYSYGFEKPSLVQQKAIVPCIKGCDVIVKSPAGTGKTLAYGLAILQNINTEAKNCQALVLVPTRELAMAIRHLLKTLASHMEITSHACVGGTKVREDIQTISQGVNVVVGTPGRVFDLIRRQALDPSTIKQLVLDEADELLSRGYQDQILDMLKLLNDSVQIIIASATKPVWLLELIERMARTPIHIDGLDGHTLTLKHTRQFYVDIEKEDWKFDALCDILDTVSVVQAVVFCNIDDTVKSLADKLVEKGYSVASIHGEMTSVDRDVIIQGFLRGDTSLLIITTNAVTNLWTGHVTPIRDFDLERIHFKVNYDLPINRMNYIQRVGSRSHGGKEGRKGVVINFVTTETKGILKDIETFYNTQVEELPEDFANFL